MERVTPPLALPHLSDLSDDELARAYAPLAEPWLRVNFVSTVDGAAQGEDGLSKSINNPADKRVFDTLRRHADCLVVGAGTLRTEGYDVPRLPLVVVSRSGDVPPTLREAPEGRILMATTASASRVGGGAVAAGRGAGARAGRGHGRPGGAQVTAGAARAGPTSSARAGRDSSARCWRPGWSTSSA